MSAPGEASQRTSRLGRYELITRIGEGGMAEVQLALQRGPAGFEKLVVVKLVHATLAAQKDFVDMLLDEARVAALLKHPNVVDIYDLGQADGRYFIAMEYLEGEPLLAVLRAGREGKRLDVLSTARLVADTAEGLDAAHELRTMGGDPLELVHHDVSLGNIVVLYNGQVKLVDFGVAKATQSVGQNRRVQGKFSYMAPEKLRGAPGDRRSDIWSLGCVLWEALTLKRLFKGGNDTDTMRQVLESEIPPPSRINSDVLPVFDPIVMRALHRNAALRYPTAKEMAAELEEVLRKEGYGGKNERIAKYMQATFASHIEARKRLLQEVSSKGRASADVLEAAFDPPLASGSPVRPSDFSGRFKPNTIEVRPPTGKPGSLEPTPVRRLTDPLAHIAASPFSQVEYPPPLVADEPDEPDDGPEDDYGATVLSAPPDDYGATVLSAPPDAVDIDLPRLRPRPELEPELEPELDSDLEPELDSDLEPELELQPGPEPGPAEPTGLRALSKIRPMYLAIAAVAIAAVVAVLVIARSSGSGAPADNAGLLTGSGGEHADAALDAAEVAVAPAADAAEGSGPPADDAAAESAGSAGSAADPSQGSAAHDASGSGSGSDAPPDHMNSRPSGKPPEKVDPAAAYKSGISAYVVGDMKTAMAQFRRAIAANPNFAMAWRGVGMVHERLGDPRSATVAFQRYLQLAPNASDAATIRGKMSGPK